MPAPPDLPITTTLPDLKRALGERNTAIVQAPPGAGKSTLLPLALLKEAWLRGQQILMLEPRRLAARSVAMRMAQLLDEDVGATVGYRVRFEQRIGPHTRLEVLTEGILTRRMQADPELAGVGLVIFDEFHERSLHADLALALCREAQSALRPDLRVLVMSATLDGVALSHALDDAPIVTTSGRQFPVTLSYALRDAEFNLPTTVADAVERAMRDAPGDALVFLPGVSEIHRTQQELEQRNLNAITHTLYGEQTLDAQQAALVPDSRGARKIVLATSIAETSLTIEGVGIVIDSGLMRVPRFDSASGMTRLETTRVTRDSADQRAGRAGRLGPGVCHRLWTEQTHARLIAQRRPEILESDLAPLRLELAQWGAKNVSDLRWITLPPPGAIQQAQELLQQLGALDGTQLTKRGTHFLDWPTHPRLAHMLIEASEARDPKLAPLAADVAALLDERDPLPRDSGADLTLRAEALRTWRATKRPSRGADDRALARVERVAQQWRKQLNCQANNAAPDAYDIGWLLLQAYPDRLAQQRKENSARYKLSNGRAVTLGESDALTHAPWLVVANLDASGSEGRAQLAAPLHEDDLTPLLQTRDVTGWDGKLGALVARREQRIGELVLGSKPINTMSVEQKTQTLCDVLRDEGLGLLNWTEEALALRARMQCARIWRGSDWPDVSDDALRAGVSQWLPPWLEGVSKRADFARLDVHGMLAAMLSQAQTRSLGSIAPTHIEVPSGSRIRLSYAMDGSPPVLAVKIQEMFGLADTPTINEGRTPVRVHLLSPAQRPIQVTQDLRSFWHNTYPVVRKELRGRYNKHPWPEDPWNAPATRRTTGRLSRPSSATKPNPPQ